MRRSWPARAPAIHIVAKKFSSVWDAIEATPGEAEDMKLRAKPMLSAAGLQVDLKIARPR